MRQRVQKFLAIGFFVALAAGGFLLASCSTLERSVITPPEIEGATFVGNKNCYECHTNYVRSFPGSPHARRESVRFESFLHGVRTPFPDCRLPVWHSGR